MLKQITNSFKKILEKLRFKLFGNYNMDLSLNEEEVFDELNSK
jgi:hypothetical protein